MKILHIFKRIDHHSNHSGYDQLTRHMSATHYRPGKIFHFLYRRDPNHFTLTFTSGAILVFETQEGQYEDFTVHLCHQDERSFWVL